MTTPDHRPFLRPGVDLVTAEDVARWLVDYPSNDAAQASIDLVARLDRERRQACRRGYKAEIQQARYHKSMEREARARLKVRHSDNDAVCAEGDLWMRRAHVERALAFRAAARAR